MKIDYWLKKISSRKFIGMVAGFVTGIIILATRNDSLAGEIGGLVMSFGSIVAYMFAEGIADSAHVGDNLIEQKEEEDNKDG